MRILHVLNELRPSGVETMLAAAAGYWREQGIAGEILTVGDRPGVYAAVLAEAGYPVHHLTFRRSPGMLLAVFRFFRSHPFDCVHIHCEQANFWYALAAFLTGHRQIVRSIQNTFGFHGGLRARRWLQRWILRRWLGVRNVAASPAVRRIEWETYRNPAEALLNWYDDRRIRAASPGARQAARRRLGIDGATLVLLTVGNCSPVKNHDAVIRALARIPRTPGWLYLHAGCEDDAPGERSLAADLGVVDRIRFLGAVLEIAPLLEAADLFLMPSLHEGLAVAALEAMGAGLPVVLADVDGLRELRAIAPAGEWVPPEDSAIAAAIQRFASLGESGRRAIGGDLSRAVRGQCGVQAGAGRYAALYREMVRV